MLKLAVLAAVALPLLGAGNPFFGRWDLTMRTPSMTYPGWLEVVDANGGMKVRLQPRSGSVGPVKDVKLQDGHLVLTQGSSVMEFTADGNALTGAEKRDGKVTGELTGVRAPALKHNPPKAWTAPEPIFNGKDLAGWVPSQANQNHWVAKDGVLLNQSKGANLQTTRKFDDFKLHVEFNCPDHGNSGLYLRGRYEVQVEYEPSEDAFHRMGAIYGFVPTTVEMPRKPGEWESFDITFIGRNVTVVRNGTTVIDRQEIAGITGGALDSNEGEPGPFYIQGDHTGGMKYRNITISVPAR